MTPTAAILIRTLNEARHLPSTLRGVLSQTSRRDEVIVIDSGSTDDTVAIAKDFGATVIGISQRVWSYPRALNVGAAHAASEILICLSAHCTPMTSDWLENLVGHFTDPRVAAVWGPGFAPGRPVPPPLPPERQLPGTYGFGNRMWGLSNSNSAIRRSLWLQFPFDETLPAAEDKAWGREALARGYHIVHDPRAGVWHATHSPRSAYRRSLAVEAGFARMFPEEASTRNSVIPRVVKAAVNRVQENFRTPSLQTIQTDLNRVPSVVAAVLGQYFGSSRRKTTGVDEEGSPAIQAGPDDHGNS